MKKIYGRTFLAMALACLPCASDAQTLVSERSISANAALEMATVALEACRKHGSVVTITVLDRADRVVVQYTRRRREPAQRRAQPAQSAHGVNL